MFWLVDGREVPGKPHHFLLRSRLMIIIIMTEGDDDDSGGGGDDGAHEDDDATLGKMSVGRQGVVLNRLQYSK